MYYRCHIFRALCRYWVNIYFYSDFFSCFFPITMFLFVGFNLYLRFSFFWLHTGLVNALGWTSAFSEAVISCFISRPWFLVGLWETIFFFSEALAPKQSQNSAMFWESCPSGLEFVIPVPCGPWSRAHFLSQPHPNSGLCLSQAIIELASSPGKS